MRQLLQNHGCTTSHANELTLHSLRLWMAEMAYQAGLPRELRAHIGQWATEATADTYTRDHRSTTLQIWTAVQTYGVIRKPLTRAEAPIDIDLIDPVEDIPGAQPKASPTKRHKKDRENTTITVPDLAKFPRAQGGPLTAALNKKTHNGKRKIHLYTTGGNSLCAMVTFEPHKVDTMSEHDWATLDNKTSMCIICTNKSRVTTTIEPQLSSGTSSEDESGNDTDSDIAAHDLPDL